LYGAHLQGRFGAVHGVEVLQSSSAWSGIRRAASSDFVSCCQPGFV
jgi:hypothetical protein